MYVCMHVCTHVASTTTQKQVYACLFKRMPLYVPIQHAEMRT